jgi:DNA repair exonuclease SbcCD ATPase subunit
LKTVEKLEERYAVVVDRRMQSREAYRQSKKELATVLEACTILQDVASSVQHMWYDNLGRIVTKCLHSVFENPYEFKLIFKKLANRTQVQFLLERDLEEYDPMSGTGGGVVDVAALALRIAALMLSVQGQRRIIIADEPFRFVSARYRAQVVALLEKLAEEFELQLIMVTHNEEYELGTVHEIV